MCCIEPQVEMRLIGVVRMVEDGFAESALWLGMSHWMWKRRRKVEGSNDALG
jgi:hypothetical protein